ncbi:MAG: DUF4198 domain-containing protein [bacterium]|nr:DUF4198 domain-containing protein [bacterium]
MARLRAYGLDPAIAQMRETMARDSEAVLLSRRVSDQRGASDLQAAPVGRLAVRVSHPGYLTVAIDDVDLEARDPLIVTLTQAASLVAKVTPLDFGAQLQPGSRYGFYLRSTELGVWPHPSWPGLPLAMPTRTDAAGELRIDQIPPGSWKIVLQQTIPFAFFSPTVESVVGELVALEAGEARSIELDLTRWIPGELRGLVLLDGEPVVGETVRLGGRGGVSVMTDASGRFRMRLPPGEYGMSVETKQGVYFADQPLVFHTTQTIERRFEFRSRKIGIRVVDGAGEGVPGLRLLLAVLTAGPPEVLTPVGDVLTTDGEGRAIFLGGPTGQVSVSLVGESGFVRVEPETVILDTAAVGRGIRLRVLRSQEKRR